MPGPTGCLLQGFIPLEDGRIIINGAKLVEEGYREHKFFVLEKKIFKEICEHDLGIIGFQMVYTDNFLYLISDKQCQIYSLAHNNCRYIEDMINIHINPGCCAFNRSIYVIGGINNKTIEMYDRNTSHWSYVATLDTQLFNIQCIQINSEEILIISYKQYRFPSLWLSLSHYHSTVFCILYLHQCAWTEFQSYQHSTPDLISLLIFHTV